MSIKSFMSIVFTCTAAATFVAGTALAADIAETRYFRKLSPAVKCESSKLRESSKYSACRLKADAKAVRKDIAADYAKCEVKFADMWTHVENRAGAGNCPSEGDQASMDSRITTDVAEVATLLSGACTAASSYNCAIGAICSTWAATYPDNLPYYTNNYVGDTAALTGCDPGNWTNMSAFADLYDCAGLPHCVSLWGMAFFGAQGTPGWMAVCSMSE